MTKIQELLLTNMKEARVKLEYSQMKLAELSNLSTSYIGDIEIGKKFPSANSLQRIADALGLKPYQLFFDKSGTQNMSKFNMLTKLKSDLIKKINTEIDTTIKNYITK